MGDEPLRADPSRLRSPQLPPWLIQGTRDQGMNGLQVDVDARRSRTVADADGCRL